MKLNLLLLATTAIGSSLPQIYLSPSPPSISHSQRPLSLTAPQANAILAHNLGVSQYERLPPSASNVKGGNDWKEALATSNLGEGEGPKMIILMECPRAGCKGTVPSLSIYIRPIADLSSSLRQYQISSQKLSKTRDLTTFPISHYNHGLQSLLCIFIV